MPIEILGGGGTGAPFSGQADDVSVAATPINYTAATPDVEAHLAGIDAALAAVVGNTILSGTGAPDNGTGSDGDYYIDTATTTIYGPKAAGVWPAGVVLPGDDGLDGVDGNTILSGTGAPAGGTGSDGDYYIDTATLTIYGPKASGTWPAGVVLPGDDGTDGLDGDGTVTFLAGEFRYPATNPAPLVETTGTNGTQLFHVFDDTTEEFVIADFVLPDNLDAAGTVTFVVRGNAVTAAASKNVALRVSTRAIAAGESWDATYVTTDSGDKALYATDKYQDVLSFSKSVADLGWAAGDSVELKLSRIDASANDLSGDYGVAKLQVKIPRI